MSFRSFEITVGKKGVTPSVISNAGVQGEHNATELVFKLDSDVQSALSDEQTIEKTLYYRFDGYDGAGNKSSTEPKKVTNLSGEFSFLLENWITQNGININVCLVFTAVNDNETEVEVFSGAVKLQLRSLPAGEDISGENAESISSLCIATKEYAERAESAEQSAAASEEVCVEATEKTTEARLALEEGVTWVFDGGTASVTVKEKTTIDNVMSDESENPVANNVVKKYIDDKFDNLYNEPVSISEGGTGATTAEEARQNLEVSQAIESEDYVGCYYRTVDGETEWINPPMMLGIPYRTTKRYNGKVVYTILQNLGTLPNSTTKTVTLATGDGIKPTNYLSFQSTIYSSTVGKTHAGGVFVNNDLDCMCRICINGSKTVELLTKSDMTSYTAQILAEYTID